MVDEIHSGAVPSGSRSANRLLAIVAFTGSIGPIAAFLLAHADIPDFAKIGAIAIVVAMIIFLCVLLRSRIGGARPTQQLPSICETPSDVTSWIEEKLTALDDTNQFFGSALDPADMFRLVSSRVAEICPCSTSALFVLAEAKTKLRVAFADGKNAESFRRIEIDAGEGLGGMAAVSGEIEMDRDLMLETFSLPADALDGLRSAVAIPLFHNGDVFAVYLLYSESPLDESQAPANVLEAIGERAAPLFQSSMAFERSIASALTDVLTGLPNERAFYMILENQLAESMRYREERPLAVLAIDIKGFAEVNSELGHQAGDRVLKFVGEQIKEQLRKMDFLARIGNDEFAVILPTASEKTAFEITARIKDAFATTPCSFSDEDAMKIWLNFGWASFWKDGETANQLIRNANLRKQQEKAEEPTGVLLFRREYVN